MTLHFFAVPTLEPGRAGEELRLFLQSHRVAGIDRQLVQAGLQSHWAVCVTVVGGAPAAPAPSESRSRSRVDYKEILSAEDFATYARLRSLRKERADAEGAPPYTVFTNAQLAAMVTGGVRSLQSLGRIPGVGSQRVKKHGAAFLDALRQGEE